MNESVVRNILEETTKKILEEIKVSKNELKSALEASETRLLLKIEDQKENIKELENENLLLKQKIEYLEQKSKRNNLVIFGLNKKRAELDVETVCKEIKRLVEVELNHSEISDFYQLGNKQSAPLKIELTSYLKKKIILKNCKKLKGTGVAISEDLTQTQREDYKNLLPYLTHHRESGKYTKCFIQGSTLVLDNERFTLQDLLDTKEDNIENPESSAQSNYKEIIKKTNSKIHNKVQEERNTFTTSTSKPEETTKKTVEKHPEKTISTRSTALKRI